MKLKLTSLTIICTMMLIACGDSSNESSTTNQTPLTQPNFKVSNTITNISIENTPVSETWHEVTLPHRFVGKLNGIYFGYDAARKGGLGTSSPGAPPPKPTPDSGPFTSYVSKDAVTWQKTNLVDALYPKVFDGKYYYAKTRKSTGVYRSVDTINWEKTSDIALQNIIYHQPTNTFIGSGLNKIATSKDGKSWQEQNLLTSGSVAYFGGQFLSTGIGQMISSPDGYKWSIFPGFKNVFGLGRMLVSNDTLMMPNSTTLYIYHQGKWHTRKTPIGFRDFQSNDTGFTATYQNAVYTSKDAMNWVRKANIAEKDEKKYTCADYPCQVLGWKVYAVVK